MTQAAIFILTQNTPERRVHLKTCLYFLFKNFNAAHKYPVRIFHEGDYDARSQHEILMGVRTSCRHLVGFVAMDPRDWALPAHIDRGRMERSIALKVVPYWRNEKYRLMCRWWVMNMHKYAAGFEYVMRMDDDSIIEENITRDLFAWAKEKELVYVSNLVHMDCGVCCYGMKEFFEERFPDKREVLQKMFVSAKIPTNVYAIPNFRGLLAIHCQSEGKTLPPVPEGGYEIHQPIIAYNNWFITQTAFWRREDVQATLAAVDAQGGMFYFRWGDAPIHTLVTAMHAEPQQLQRAVFSYSKRMQREAFPGDDGQFHSYMPDTYDKTSSVA